VPLRAGARPHFVVDLDPLAARRVLQQLLH
jgi:hypothetical protein